MTNLTPNLDFVVFYVSNLDSTLDYFTNKLGFGYMPEGSGPEFKQLQGGNGIPNFGLSLATSHTPPAGTVVVYFKTGDVAGLREEVTGQGVEASAIQHLPFGNVFEVRTGDQQILAMMGQPD